MVGYNYLHHNRLVIGPILCILPLIGNKFEKVLLVSPATDLKRAVAKDRGEDGSGQHGEDGQQDRNAGCDYRTVIAVQ